MPAIGTSSDQYQPRDPALTTYRKNTAAPTLAEAMAQRPADKAKAAVERRPIGSEPPKAPVGQAAPPKPLQELYAPPSRPKREPDDRFSMTTGGTIDVRV